MNSERIFRVLGRRGRTTIPYAIRKRNGFRAGDILSFEDLGDDTVIIRRESVCEGCCDSPEQEDNSVYSFLDDLSAEEQHALIEHLLFCYFTNLERGRNARV